jgi:hypothetical protein
MIDHPIFVGRRGRQQQDKVVPMLRLGFGRRSTGDVAKPDIVDDNLGVVLLPPLFDETLVEPSVVVWNEMLPLHDLERLLLSAGPAGDDAGRYACKQRRRSCCSQRFRRERNAAALCTI